MHNNLLHSPIFFNPWILRNSSVKDFTNYVPKKPDKDFLKPESFSPSIADCASENNRHADEQGFKPLSLLKDDPGFATLNWFTQFRIKKHWRNLVAGTLA